MSSINSFLLKSPEGIGHVKDYLDVIPEDQFPLEVKIGKFKRSRTFQQNRLLWAILTQLEAETGNDKEAIHVFMKAKFLGYDEKEIFGQKVNVAKSTTTLTTSEFVEYIRKIEILAMENGYTLWHPHYYDYAMSTSTRGKPRSTPPN